MSSNSTYTSVLTAITSYIPLIINFLTVIIGPIGGICNLITFTAPRLRQNSCVFYLLCASIFEILSIIFLIPTRIALDNFGNTLERQSTVFCKIRYYLSLALPELVTYYILLAIIDRCLATSDNVGVRSWSQLKVAHRLSFALLVIALGATTHSLVFYEISNNTCQVPPGSVYTIFFAVYLAIIIIILPHTLMFICSLITIANLRRTRRRIVPRINQQLRSRTKRYEVQLVFIILIQVILSSLLVSIRLGSYTYTTLTSADSNKTINARIIETFVLRLGIALYYFSFAISFYVCTLTSRFFREIFWKRLREILRHCQRF